jgi:hypothetical protein
VFDVCMYVCMYVEAFLLVDKNLTFIGVGI